MNYVIAFLLWCVALWIAARQWDKTKRRRERRARLRAAGFTLWSEVKAERKRRRELAKRTARRMQAHPMYPPPNRLDRAEWMEDEWA